MISKKKLKNSNVKNYISLFCFVGYLSALFPIESQAQLPHVQGLKRFSSLLSTLAKQAKVKSIAGTHTPVRNFSTTHGVIIQGNPNPGQDEEEETMTFKNEVNHISHSFLKNGIASQNIYGPRRLLGFSELDHLPLHLETSYDLSTKGQNRYDDHLHNIDEVHAEIPTDGHSLQDFQTALRQVHSRTQPGDKVKFYLLGHGHSDFGLGLKENQFLPPWYLKKELDDLICRRNLKQVELWVNSCFSGIYLPLTSPRLGIFASSKADRPTLLRPYQGNPLILSWGNILSSPAVTSSSKTSKTSKSSITPLEIYFRSMAAVNPLYRQTQTGLDYFLDHHLSLLGEGENQIASPHCLPSYALLSVESDSPIPFQQLLPPLTQISSAQEKEKRAKSVQFYFKQGILEEGKKLEESLLNDFDKEKMKFSVQTHLIQRKNPSPSDHSQESYAKDLLQVEKKLQEIKEKIEIHSPQSELFLEKVEIFKRFARPWQMEQFLKLIGPYLAE